MRTSLLPTAHVTREPSRELLVVARRLGLTLRPPASEAAIDFDALLAQSGPGGAVLLGGSPMATGATDTGIPFTDAPRARDMLGLDVAGGRASSASAAFWDVAQRVAARRAGGSFESFFANFHVAHAFPYAVSASSGSHGEARPGGLPLVADDVARIVAEAPDAALADLRARLATLRPKVLVTFGRFAFESAASLARNRHDLAAGLAERSWDGFVLAREYGLGARALVAEYPRFRAILVPLDELDGAFAEHARDNLARILDDCWP
ncbi:MAG: uracil-DNA glycosylase family protein [Thermoplasmatota archaeon]